MEISVSGKGIDIGESFQEHAQERLSDGLSKYLDRIVSVDVAVSKDAHLFDVRINANPGTASNIVVKSTGRAGDIYAAFDAAAEKAEKQFRRYKRRITNHHRNAETEVIDFSTTQYTLDPAKEEVAESDQSDALVIAETKMDINTLTVSEAVMRLDIGELPALVFTNAANGMLNVIYRREDGNISWIDPSKQNKGKVA